MMISNLLLASVIGSADRGLHLSGIIWHLDSMHWLHESQYRTHGGLPKWIGRRTTSARIKVGHYHTIPQARGNLYQAVRKVTGMTRSAMAKVLGITEHQLRYRERVKRTYHLCEVMALFVASGISWDDYGQLLNDIA